VFVLFWFCWLCTGVNCYLCVLLLLVYIVDGVIVALVGCDCWLLFDYYKVGVDIYAVLALTR